MFGRTAKKRHKSIQDYLEEMAALDEAEFWAQAETDRQNDDDTARYEWIHRREGASDLAR